MARTVAARQEMERRIIRAVVTDLIKAGYLVQVSYERGFDNVHKPSVFLAEIMLHVQACDEEHLMVYDPSTLSRKQTKATSYVYLVYGNDGWDVVSDYTVDLEETLARSNKLADKLGE